MGLDNGIRFKERINENELPIGTPEFVKVRLNSKYFNDICYWRKCWGLRDAIMEKLHFKEKDGGYFNIYLEDIPVIKKIIIHFMNPTVWEEEGDSIWDFEEYVEQLSYDVIALSWLEEYMTEHSEVEVYFYDSY